MSFQVLKESRAITPPLRVLAHAGTHPLLLNQMSFRVPQGISLPQGPPLRVLAPPLEPNVIPSPSRNLLTRACGDPSPPLEPHVESLKESRCHLPPSPCPRACGDPSPPLEPNVIPSPSRNLVTITPRPPCPRACGDPSPPLEPNVIPSPSRNLVAITAPPPCPRACGDPHPLLLRGTLKMSFRVPQGISLPSRPPSVSSRMRGPIPSS